MRLFFTGPRILGVRPGVSFNATELTGGSLKRAPGQQITGAFVYVVRGDHNMVKIGVTTNPDARLSQLRTGSAFPIEYAWLGVTPGTGYDIEQAAHTALASHRCHGEWFDVPPEQAVAAVAAVAFKLEQPIAAVRPEDAAQILRISAQGGVAKQQQAVGPIARTILWMLAGAFVTVVTLIIIGSNTTPK